MNILNIFSRKETKQINLMDIDVLRDTLFEIITQKDVKELDRLVANGLDIHTEGIALKISVMNGKLDFIKYLHSQNVDLQSNDNMAIKFAARFGYLDIIEYLHQNGSSINDATGSILTNACEYNKIKIVNYLIDNNVDIQADFNNPLRQASEEGHLEIVKLLVLNGANIDDWGFDAVKRASANGHLEIAKYLSKNGSSKNLDYAIMYAKPSIKEQLVEYKLSIDENEILKNDLNEVKSIEIKKNNKRI